MLSVYIDESGTHEGARVLCVAACVATPEQWRSFEGEWRAHLDGTGVSDYHAKRCHDGRLNLALAALMKRHSVHGVALTVDEREFQAAASPRWRSTLGSAYSSCIMWCLAHLDERTHSPEGPIEIFLEAGHRNMQQALERLRSWQSFPFNRVATVGTVNKDALASHAADLLSHEVATNYPETNSPTLIVLGDTVSCRHVDGETMRMFNDAVAAGARWPRLGHSRGAKTPEGRSEPGGSSGSQ